MVCVAATPGAGTSHHTGTLRNLQNCSHFGSEELSILPTVTQHFLSPRKWGEGSLAGSELDPWRHNPSPGYCKLPPSLPAPSQR